MLRGNALHVKAGLLVFMCVRIKKKSQLNSNNIVI